MPDDLHGKGIPAAQKCGFYTSILQPGQHQNDNPVAEEASMDEHFVRFYENEASLAAQVGSFIGAGLENGDRCIIIATQPHRDAIERQLRMRGRTGNAATVDVSACLMLDAAETLSSLTIDDWPQEAAVNDFFGKLISDASRGGRRRVRLFGEMVAILAEANEDAAIRLEALFSNSLCEPHSISALCAYPIQTIIGGHFRSLIRICAEHTGVALPESLWASAYVETALSSTRAEPAV